MTTKEKKYYVYRFLNKNGVVLYVGRTKNLQQRFLQHSHLTDDVVKIEYIECSSDADMAWKEIYYINLFYNKLSTNAQDVYTNGRITDLHLNDVWVEYLPHSSTITLSEEYVIEKYQTFVLNAPQKDYKSLIHIVDHKKLNRIGESKYALTKKWFADNPSYVKQLANNLRNYFRNIKINGEISYTTDNLWTTYVDCRSAIKGKGYTKGFVDMGEDMSKCYSKRNKLAFAANIFYPVGFHCSSVSENNYALSELLQFIWRSAIRDGKEIWLYLPSIRMLNLLQSWINENSMRE